MSCQGTWADAIIIQAVVNCLNLSKLPSSISQLAPLEQTVKFFCS